MARQISDVIDQIIALLPNPAPPEVVDNIGVLGNELNIIRRTGSYTAPEAADAPALWARLCTALYRYLPNPEGYTWAAQISTLVTTIPFTTPAKHK